MALSPRCSARPRVFALTCLLIVAGIREAGAQRETAPTVSLSSATIADLNRAFDAGTLTAFISSFSSPQGLFLAKLSAASLLAIAPILLMGWFSQKQLVCGLTFGAVK